MGCQNREENCNFETAHLITFGNFVTLFSDQYPLQIKFDVKEEIMKKKKIKNPPHPISFWFFKDPIYLHITPISIYPVDDFTYMYIH